MSSIHIVRASGLLPFVSFLDNLGTPVDRLLHAQNLNRDLVFDPQAFCTELQRWAFIEQCARLEGIDNLGGLIGLNSPFEKHGFISKVVLQELILEDAITSLFRISAFHSTLLQKVCFLKKSSSEAFVGFTKPYSYKVIGDTNAETTTLFSLLKLIQAYLGTQWKPSKIYIPTVANIKFWQSFPEIEGIKLHFQSPYYAIVFPRRLLQSQRRLTNIELPPPEAFSWLGFGEPESFIDKFRLLIPSLIQQNIIKIEEVSEILKISKRTLQRNLNNEGTSYRKILEQSRYEIAVKKLTNSKCSIEEIALDLGYSCPEHFSRAFKRSSGTNPSTFRQHFNNFVAQE